MEPSRGPCATQQRRSRRPSPGQCLQPERKVSRLTVDVGAGLQQVPTAAIPVEHSPCEEAARDAVEVIKEPGLDHGEQVLSIARQKAPRLASIEGRKLFGQQPPRLRLVVVRVGDEVDLDTPLVAAHCHTHAHTNNSTERREIGGRELCPITLTVRGVLGSNSRRPLRTNVKSSMTHHSLEQYVGPATTSSVWQPARKTGKQASDCWMLFWSMHALSCVRAVRCV